MTATRWCGLLALFLLLPPPAPAADDLAARIDEVIHGPNYKSARWGILVVEAEGDKVVYSHNADLLFSPASVTKLYSCAAAMVALGKDHVFETPIHARGDLTRGVLYGDLILVGSGDPTMGGRATPDGKLEFKNHDHIYAGYMDTRTELTDADPLAGLKVLARQVKKAGVERVEGDVLIDDRLFERARGSGSGPDILSPLMINDNIVDVRVTPGTKAGEPAKVELRPTTEYMQIDAQVRTGPANSGTRITTEHVGPQRFVVRGSIAANSGPVVRICPVHDPAGFARALLIDALRSEGVRVRASALRAPTAELPPRDGYEKLKRVAVLKSPPLSEALKVTLKVSHNLYASTLPLLLAAHSGKRTYPEGMHLQGKALKGLGVDVGAISFQSGAGGGNSDRVTPRVTVQLLQSMARRPDGELYRDMLPVLGVDGSLADVIDKESPARGKVVGKTGTYTDADLMNDRPLLRAKSLAGYMTTESGKKLVYAIFVNDVPLPAGVDGTREGKVIAKLCELIYLHGP
jgi:D-alanyl-D-alanine carboxypeptidase/D-alanyl-D-alanine-endopeptidase (penicillin-binding protein 4)